MAATDRDRLFGLSMAKKDRPVPSRWGTSVQSREADDGSDCPLERCLAEGMSSGGVPRLYWS
jgi:hypothetical protein